MQSAIQLFFALEAIFNTYVLQHTQSRHWYRSVCHAQMVGRLRLVTKHNGTNTNQGLLQKNHESKFRNLHPFFLVNQAVPNHMTLPLIYPLSYSFQSYKATATPGVYLTSAAMIWIGHCVIAWPMYGFCQTLDGGLQFIFVDYLRDTSRIILLFSCLTEQSSSRAMWHKWHARGSRILGSGRQLPPPLTVGRGPPWGGGGPDQWGMCLLDKIMIYKGLNNSTPWGRVRE